jgi:hypothetical protein
MIAALKVDAGLRMRLIYAALDHHPPPSRRKRRRRANVLQLVPRGGAPPAA